MTVVAQPRNSSFEASGNRDIKTPRPNRPGVVLNIARVNIDDAKLRVGFLEYESREQLRDLRKKHNETHIFLRQRGDRVACVPFVLDAPDVGDKFETIRLADNLSLAAALVRNALLIHLHNLGKPVYDYRPICFLATGPKDNLLKASLPSGVSCPPWLSVNPLYTADVRVFRFDGLPAFVGIALNVRSRSRIDRSCEEFVADGFSLIGNYVGRFFPTTDVRIQPKLKLCGRVERIEADMLMLSDTRPGESSIPLAEAFLQKGKAVFDDCLSHVFGEQAEQIKVALQRKLVEIRTGPTRLSKLRAVVAYLGKTPLEIVPGVSARFGKFMSQSECDYFPRLEKAPRPTYVFDDTGAKTSTWHDSGLKEYGPYSSRVFDKNRPRICIICQGTKKGQVEQFLHKFLRGMTVPGIDNQPFNTGFIRKYALDDVETEFFLADDDTPEAYQRAVQEAITRQEDENAKWDFALVQIEDRFRSLHGVDNPYLRTKVAFLTHQIPVQEFNLETASLPANRLAYALNNMALASYAKLGGTPWLIQSDRAIAYELVIGLGSASIGQGRLGDRKRMVGITTVFSGDGTYYLSNVSRAVPADEYERALLASLRKTVADVRRDMNWQPKDHIRLVFHAFKPFKNTEAQAVKKVMSELEDFDIDFAFLHVEVDHPYLLFDETQLGVGGYGNNAPKGVFAPERGKYLRLSDREILLTLTGPNDVKRPEDGLPRQVLMRLHRESTFKDTTYLARQATVFACHSWRSFFPASMPVTILYSELIAGLLGELATIPDWNPDNVMTGRIGRTRWFL